jgi:hypothetical protein
MPALPVIAGSYLITQRLLEPNERHVFVNVMAVHDATGGSSASSIAEKFAVSYSNHILPFMSNSVTMGDTSVLPLDGSSSTQTFITTADGNIGGHNTGTSLPYAVAMVLAWQTGLRGRSKRGRSFIPGVTTDMMLATGANGLTATQLTAMATGGNAFIAALLGGAAPSLALGVLSRVHGTFTDVTNARADGGAGIQRRRFEVVARH